MFSLDVYKKMVMTDPLKAKEYCLKYPDDNYAKCELVILDVLFFRENDWEQDAYELEMYFKNLKDEVYKYRIANILSYAFDEVCELKKSIKYSKYALKNEYNPHIAINYYVDCLILDKNEEEAMENLSKILFNEKLENEEIEKIVNAICSNYLSKNNETELNKFLDKCYLVLNHAEEISIAEFNSRIARKNGDKNKLKNSFFETIKTFDNDTTFNFFYYHAPKLIENDCNVTLEIIEELEKNCDDEEKENNLMMFKASCYFYMDKYAEAYKLFNKVKEKYLNKNPYCMFVCGTNILYLNDRRKFVKGIKFLYKLDEMMYNPIVKKNLCYLYMSVDDYESAKNVCESMKDEFDYDIISRILVKELKDYDEAEGILKMAYRNEKFMGTFYNYYCKNNDSLSKKCFKRYLKKETSEDYRNLAIMYLHGFGVAKKSDLNKAKEYIEEALKKDDKNYCARTVLGNIYLKEKEEKKAFEIFENGMNAYFKYKDNCTCSVGYYCYCLALGIGCKKDEKKAKQILEEVIYTECSDICTYTYAYLCLKFNKDLEIAYNKLLDVYEWRYDEGKYFMLIKVAKALELDYSEYEKKFKDNLKHLPVEERNFYKNNPSIFYLTNI